ncbi:hypothetical protein [Terrilactibacillus laevilacticus]|uniref:Uncharacterized protein n=2 Tax=Terrilactibacillus laevilacticus TaxID=1380157 RepID=A0ABW5PPI6_9BACI|nr:hypothetical protein [Terrilactibacillus laevilacticus]
MMLQMLNLVLVYLICGTLISGSLTILPFRKRSWKTHAIPFLILTILWFPISIVTMMLAPFIHNMELD